jgi:hypothetical protein
MKPIGLAFVAASLLMPCLSAEPPVAANYLALPIPELRIEQKSVKEVIDVLTAAANAAEAHRFGFRGIAIVDPADGDRRVTMNLRGVPFGKAVQYVAEVIGCTLVEGNGLCVLYPNWLPEPALVTDGFELSEAVRHQLILPGATGTEALQTRLGSFGVQVSTSGEVRYIAERSFLYAKLSRREMELLRSLITLIDRGIGVTSRGDQAPK